MKPPPVPATLPAEPAIIDGTDPVLLMRLYPDAINIDAASAVAVAAGKARAAQGAALEAQMLVPTLDGSGNPIAPPPVVATHPAPHEHDKKNDKK
jgi:hypothetical protein